MLFPVPKKILLYIALAIVIYLFSLLATIPANMVVKQILPAQKPSLVKFNSISGSIWQGQASQVEIKQVPLGNVEWELSALPLLWGTASVQLTGKREGAVVITDASIRVNSIKLEDTRLELAITDLMPLLYGFPISLDGGIKGFFKNIEIEPASRFSLEGRAVLSDIELIAPQAMSLGDLVMKFENQDNGTRITVNDQQGPVQVEGVVTLAETGFYTVNLTMTPRTSTDASIKNALAMFAKADNQGRYTISTRGRVPLKF